ncbi:MAG TPA: hypothetical protein PLK19_07125 [Mycobacterium sp.]|nr:hypothetical protein [Mycobacterium sp.]
MASTNDEATQIDELIQRVAEAHPEISVADVERAVRVIHAGFDDARVRDFVPMLVERKVRAVLAHRQTSIDWST